MVRALAPPTSRDREGTDSVTPLHRLDFQEAVLRIGTQLADALAYAQRMGVCHLDVKRSNIILNYEGRPFLIDFNVAIQPGVLWLFVARDGATAFFASPFVGRALATIAAVGLAGVGYAALFCQTGALLALYPRFWIGERHVSETAKEELRRLSGALRLPTFFIIAAPLALAELVSLDGRWPSEGREATVLALGGVVLLGAAFAAALTQRIRNYIASFTNRS